MHFRSRFIHFIVMFNIVYVGQSKKIPSKDITSSITTPSKRKLTEKIFMITHHLYSSLGYKPSNAFDNNPDTLWISNGAAPPGMQWIAFEFDKPVYVGSVRLALEDEKPERSPSMMYVEASCEKYFKNFVTAWVINNPRLEPDKRYSGKYND